MGLQKIKLIFIYFLLLNSILLFSNGNNEFKTLEEKVENMYTFSVKTLKPSELNSMIDEVYLIDTRMEEEFNISSIKDANFINYKSFNIEVLSNIPKNTNIVLYCTIGYRSEKIGEELMEAGFSSVFNLYGGIMNWVNNGYTIYSGNKETLKLHTYSKSWDKYITNTAIEKVN